MPRVSGQLDDAGHLTRLGSAVRARRKAQGLSQEALADQAEVDRFHMGKIERGERNVTILNIIRIASALGCKPSELMADADM